MYGFVFDLLIIFISYIYIKSISIYVPMFFIPIFFMFGTLPRKVNEFSTSTTFRSFQTLCVKFTFMPYNPKLCKVDSLVLDRYLGEIPPGKAERIYSF